MISSILNHLTPLARLVFACGTALFSDGYQNNAVGGVNLLIRTIYKGDPNISASRLKNYATTFSATGFAGTVVGMLVFGLLSDRIGRKFGMILATIIGTLALQTIYPFLTTTDTLFVSSPSRHLRRLVGRRLLWR